MGNKAVNSYTSAISVPDQYKTQGMCEKAVDTYSLHLIPLI